MTKAPTFNDALSPGLYARIQRVSRLLTQQEIAAIAGVTQEDVELLESNRRLHRVAKRKLMKTFELIKAVPLPF